MQSVADFNSWLNGYVWGWPTIILLVGTGLLLTVVTGFAQVRLLGFNGTAATGGFAGSTVMMAIRFGIALGLFSNEAGLGSAPMVHAAAQTDHPVRQGLYGIFEVFVDTILICTTTGLVILLTSSWDLGISGGAMSARAWLVFIYLGAVGSLHLVWDVADTLNGLMAIPNLIAVLASIPLLLKLQREFFSKPR